MKRVVKLAGVSVLLLGAWVSLCIVFQGYIDHGHSRFEKHLAGGRVSEAASDWLRFSRLGFDPAYEVDSARRLWIAANGSETAISGDATRATSQTDALMLRSLDLALADIADTSNPLAALRMAKTARQVIGSLPDRERAFVKILALAVTRDTESAGKMMPLVASFLPEVRKQTPPVLLATSYKLQGRHVDVVAVRKRHVPSLMPPLAVEAQALLVIETISANEALGRAQAAALAGAYLDNRLVTDTRFMRELNSYRPAGHPTYPGRSGAEPVLDEWTTSTVSGDLTRPPFS